MEGWVRPFKTIDPTVEWQKTIKVEQDIDMDRIGEMARRNQPGIIIVDRTVPGKWGKLCNPLNRLFLNTIFQFHGKAVLQWEILFICAKR